MIVCTLKVPLNKFCLSIFIIRGMALSRAFPEEGIKFSDSSIFSFDWLQFRKWMWPGMKDLLGDGHDRRNRSAFLKSPPRVKISPEKKKVKAASTEKLIRRMISNRISNNSMRPDSLGTLGLILASL